MIYYMYVREHALDTICIATSQMIVITVHRVVLKMSSLAREVDVPSANELEVNLGGTKSSNVG